MNEPKEMVFLKDLKPNMKRIATTFIVLEVGKHFSYIKYT